jgi:hypothetical protein
VSAADGRVTISGAPGSTHRVRLSQGGREKVATVVITDTGALPDRLELAPPVPVSSASSRGAAPVPVQPTVKPKEDPLTPSTFQ